MGYPKKLNDTFAVFRRISSARCLDANLTIQQHVLHPDVRGLVGHTQLEEQRWRRGIAVDDGTLDREGEFNHGDRLLRTRVVHAARRKPSIAFQTSSPPERPRHL